MNSTSTWVRSLDGRTAQPVSPHNANTFNGHMALFEPLLDLLVVEADPLPRTGAASGVATKWLSRPEASELAMIGTGKHAITQVSAVVAGLALRLYAAAQLFQLASNGSKALQGQSHFQFCLDRH